MDEPFRGRPQGIVGRSVQQRLVVEEGRQTAPKTPERKKPAAVTDFEDDDDDFYEDVKGVCHAGTGAKEGDVLAYAKGAVTDKKPERREVLLEDL